MSSSREASSAARWLPPLESYCERQTVKPPLMSLRANVLFMMVSEVPLSYVISPVCDAGKRYVMFPTFTLRVWAMVTVAVITNEARNPA